MTGAAIVGFAPDGLSLLTALAKRLSRSLVYRWRVFRYVKRRVGFAFPHVRYRRWLKSICVDDLSHPAESGTSLLARSLDGILATNQSWAANNAHQQLAERLVSETYDAMLAFAEDADARLLEERWQRARHKELLAAITALDPPRSRAEISEQLLRESDGRRQARLRSFGLPEARVDAALELLNELLALPSSRQVTVLVGPYGAGKSEMAEAWIRERISYFLSDAEAGLPVWIHATELSGSSLDTLVTARLKDAHQTDGAAAVVIDGLDETNGQTAWRAYQQATALVVGRPPSRVLLTSRPGVLSAGDDETLCEGLDVEQARKLMEAVAGTQPATWSWDPALIDSLRRPFFAIAAGVLLSGGKTPAGQAELINALVERALEAHSSSAVAVQEPAVFDLLVRVAVTATRTANQDDGLSFPERQTVRTSNLLWQSLDGHLEFSLPIFQQWFAAQALLKDTSLVDEATVSGELFDKWRWALAVMGLIAPRPVLDDLLERSLRANAGAGAWLLSQLAHGHSWFRASDAAFEIETNAPERLLRAARVWIDSIGALAPRIFPIISPSQPIALGVDVTERTLRLAWKTTPGTTDTVESLPPWVHPFAQNTGEWAAQRAGAYPAGPEWPWVVMRDMVAGATLGILNSAEDLGPDDGVWRMESRYRAARLLTNSRSGRFPPISREAVVQAASGLKGAIDDQNLSRTRIVIRGRTILGQVIEDLLASSHASADNWLERPVPVPDLPTSSGGSWIWNPYSDARLQEFYAEVLGLASQAYLEVASTTFAALGWSLGLAADPGFGVIARLSFTDSPVFGDHAPGLSSAIVTGALFDQAVAERGTNALLATRGRALVTLASDGDSEDWVDDFVRSHMREAALAGLPAGPFAHGPVHSLSMADHEIHERPASLFAAQWLFDELKKLDLGKGAFPQLQ